MNKKICDQCETVSHCLKNGCIPVTPAPAAPKAEPLPSSYRAGTVTSQPDGSGKVTFYFADAASAKTWHNTVIHNSTKAAEQAKGAPGVDAEDSARLDWIEERTHDSSHSIQVRLVRDPAINAGINRIELRTSCGSGVYERAFEGNSLRSAIDAARAAQEN